jgi:hypothetical protein
VQAIAEPVKQKINQIGIEKEVRLTLQEREEIISKRVEKKRK